MTPVKVCFEKSVNSVFVQMPDLEELYAFKKCIRKYARVKMRAVTYYNSTLHRDQDLITENVKLLRPYLNE